MKSRLYIKSFAILIIILGLWGCETKIPDILWDYSNADIVGVEFQKSDQINIDVYIDATTSMEGFAVNINSDYSQFLDQLETSALSAWGKADLKFYKFGQKVKKITRDDFIKAKNDLNFYHEPGIFLNTYIDSVVKRTDISRLSVVVTDLFQDEGDVNMMVESFKEKCFARGVVVGIVGVKSEFKGKVFDVLSYPNGYNLNVKERPFYAIMFGNPGNMEQLFESLKAKPFVKENQFLIFSPYIVKSYDIKLSKTRDSKYVNKISSHNQSVKNAFDFSMKKDGTEASFTLEIEMDRNSRCPDFISENLEIVVLKKSLLPKVKNASVESVKTNEIKVENMQRSGGKITANLILKNEEGIGNYSYLIYLKTNQLNGLVVPDWIKEFSTDNPVPNTPSASLTYNLDKFASTLLVANSSITPVYIAKLYLNIYKR